MENSKPARHSPWRRIAGGVTALAGVVVGGTGLFLAGAYVYRAVDVLDEPDRSWLFWGLAILFIGVFLTGVGVTLIVLARALLRSPRSDRTA